MHSILNTFKNYAALTKLRIVFFCLIMTAAGLYLADKPVSLLVIFSTLLGTAFSIASANTFNMILEQKLDKLMIRTKNRPLAAGRLKASHALVFAVLLGVFSFLILYLYVNLLTAVLATVAIIFYSAIYTPLKVKTPLALVLGAIPGAMPPLLGWTAVTNQITPQGLTLFGVLFAWQMPHFIAISLNHKEDYHRAGIKIVSLVRGDRIAKIQAFLWTLALLFASILPIPFQLGGFIYTIFAVVLGFWFLQISYRGLEKNPPAMWAKKFFYASLIYLPVLMTGLVADRFFYLK